MWGNRIAMPGSTPELFVELFFGLVALVLALMGVVGLVAAFF